jgi:hypothetical protein
MQKNVKLICKGIFNNRKYISQLQTLLRQVRNILHANILHQRRGERATLYTTNISHSGNKKGELPTKAKPQKGGKFNKRETKRGT